MAVKRDRNKIVSMIKSWHGILKGSSVHHAIIDIYNTVPGVPKMNYTASWCAATFTAVYQAVGYADMIPTGCSCGQLIEKAKKMGIWVEDDSFIPSPADGIIYAWTDPKPKEDNTTGHDHIGIVTSVVNNSIYVEEGNKGKPSCVGTRIIPVNGKNIRGFIHPNFGDAESSMENNVKPTLRKGAKGIYVTMLQTKLQKLGYDLGKSAVDGSFGSATFKAVKEFQKNNYLLQDGIVGPKTWKALGLM